MRDGEIERLKGLKGPGAVCTVKVLKTRFNLLIEMTVSKVTVR